jgi:enoyl-CoA hydratase
MTAEHPTEPLILIERGEPLPQGVAVARLNRPAARNALNAALMRELFSALESFDRDPTLGAIVLTGSDKAFAAGADIRQMADQSAVDLLHDDFTDWSRLRAVRKPIIAAVSGWALGGGCELAMACDLIVASETAVFGQPEVTLGILPGAGGTQRLTRAVGKALAFEVMLGARNLSAAEALAAGLVNRVYPVEAYLAEALALAGRIAALPQVAVALLKDAVNGAYEGSLTEGLLHEKRNFLLAFTTEDKTEGMRAFIEKRPPQWKHR